MSKKTHVFCVANQKGGVGKTTTAINFAAALAKQKKKVLLIDLDPQGNATMGSGIEKNQLKETVYHVLIGQKKISDVLTVSEKNLYDVLPSNRDLSGADIDLMQLEDREYQLKNAIKEVDGLYDFILIDCPPTLSLLTLNALSAANGVIIPMQCEYFALEGLSDLVNTIKLVHQGLNPQLNMIYVLRVMFDRRMSLQQQVSNELETHFKDNIFKEVIPRNVRLAEAPGYGMSGVVYAPSSRGAKAYISCAKELIRKIKNKSM
ncbi:MAG: AAA family ATPase [Alcaligenaceae bacterium]|nr:AAA family ATPase [Alcaligenaceae bacterium]